MKTAWRGVIWISISEITYKLCREEACNGLFIEGEIQNWAANNAIVHQTAYITILSGKFDIYQLICFHV